MGIPSEMRDIWVNKRNGFIIASPVEDQNALNARRKLCNQESIREGFKNATIAAVVSAVPTLVAVRKIPWAKANLNYTAQALIISAASIAAFFITADKTTLECARRNALLEDALRRQR
ncbi:early nodulin-93 [Quercus suber]|uniref:Early nodulin-93 n=1 Tax=Quercus suber TaxID=58331 RepID=A0AAW0J778_QUESU|nr:early nodulin-93-like [Quercus suber]POE61963.1 early nodulin-93 [Quercus suber]